MKRKKSLEEISQSDINLPPKKKGQQFSGLMFRQKITGEESLHALKLFVENSRARTSELDIVLEYLESGGNGEDILQMLAGEDKNPEIVKCVFSALECVFMRVATDLISYLPEAEETARCLLQSHLSAVYLLLSVKSSVEDKKAVLRLLTVLSTLSAKVARNVLMYLKLSNSMLYGLTRYDNPNRSVFIHFVLSFLVEGNPHVIRLLLDKKEYLRSIIPGLVYDSVDSVEMVIAIMQKHVLENPLINKTTKMHAFNTSILKSFFELFNWKGPQKKLKKVKTSLESHENEVDANAKEDVQKALYSFLCILCGSTKLGVVFFDPTLGTSGKNQNLLVHKVLEALEKPWEQKTLADLLVRIFASCPDLIPYMIHDMVPFLEPRVSSKWFAAMDFIGKVIDTADPSTYLSKQGSLAQGRLLSALERILIPKGVLQQVVGSAYGNNDHASDGTALLHPEILVRHSAVKILSHIVEAVTRFVDYEGLAEYFSSQSNAKQFSQGLLDLLFKVLPNVGSVFKIWKKALSDIKDGKGMDLMLQSGSTLHQFTMHAHLKAILDLLLTYAKWWPPLAVVADDDDVEDGWGLLNRESFLSEVQQFEGLELMALELLSVTGGLMLSADRSNKEILRHLLHLYAVEDEKSAYEPWKQLILTLFIKTGLFDGNEVEPCIWVHCYHICHWGENKNMEQKPDTIKEENNVLADFVASSLSNLINSSEHYLKIISTAFDDKTEKETLAETPKSKNVLQILNDMLESDFDRQVPLNKDSDFIMTQSLHSATVSPLLPAALSQAKKYPVGTEKGDVINKYLGMVVMHILYGQDTPKPLRHLVKKSFSSNCTSKALERYVKSWSTQMPHNIGQWLSDDSIFKQCSDYILDGRKSLSTFPIKDTVKLADITDGIDVLLLFRMVIFHVVNLAKQKHLNEQTLAMTEDFLEQLIQHSSLNDEEESTFLKNANVKWKRLSIFCFLSVFNSSAVLEYFEPLGDCDGPQRIVTQLVGYILHLGMSLPKNQNDIDDICCNFKSKFMHRIHDSLLDISRQEEKAKEWNKEIMEELLASFTLTYEGVIYLLKEFKNIPSTSLVDSCSWNLFGPGYLLVKLIQQLCELKISGVKLSVDPEIFCTIVDHICVLEEMFELCSMNVCGDALPHLEECLLEVLQIFPHLIKFLPKGLLLHFISSQFIRESACKLGQLVIANDETFSSLFLEQCNTNWDTLSVHLERLLSYLTCVLVKGRQSIPDTVLLRIYKKLRDTMEDAFNNLLKIPQFFVSNTQLIKLIISRAMDDDMCCTLYGILCRKVDCDGVPGSSLELVLSVIEKTEICSSFKPKEKPSLIFLRLLLHSLVNKLKIASLTGNCMIDEECQSSEAAIAVYSKFICDLMENTEKCKSSSWSSRDWKSVKKDSVWKEFSQLALKIGLGQSNSSVLKCLGKLCSRLLSRGDPEAAVLYKMSVLHSKFLDVMLENKAGKVEILELLLVLMEKNPASLSPSLIPILLSSYSATLGKCDLIIVKILKMLDCDDLNFHQFSPFLWGEIAASFYSLKQKAKNTPFSAFSVLRQPKADQVLDLLEISQVERTVNNFPIHRNLQPEVPLDVYAEICVYDPCYYLSILSHVLAPENPIKIYKVVQSGALALVVTALGSSDHKVRGAAMHTLARFYTHLETGRPSKEKKLWLNYIDSLRNGFALLASSRDSVNVSNIQLPAVVTTFLARASLVMTDPQHVMFFPLHNYFLAKPALDLDMVPEFFRLFNSSEMECRSHRHWILEVLRDGIKSELDFQTCLNNGTFKVLMVSFSSVTCDEKSKCLILETLGVAVKTPSTAYYLVKGHGLISWLHEVIQSSCFILNKAESNLAVSIIQLLSELWFSLTKEDSSKSSPDSQDHVSPFMLLISNCVLHLFLSFLPKLLLVELHLADYVMYMSSLLSVTEIYNKGFKGKGGLMQEQDVKNAILLGEKVLKNVNICEDALELGCNLFPTSTKLLSLFDCNSVEALKCLFSFIVCWHQIRRKTGLSH